MESLTLEIYRMRKGGKYMYMYIYLHTHTHTHIYIYTYIFIWRWAWQPIPVFLPGEPPWTEEPGRIQPMGSQSQTQLTKKHAHARAQSLSRVWLFGDSMDCSSPGSSVHGDFPGKKTGVGCHFLLQRIFLAQRLNLYLLHWQVDSLPLETPEKCLYPSLVLKWCK